MNEHQTQEGSIINSIIGTGTKFKGEFELNGVLRIDGDFTGSIQTKGRVFIGSTGRAECIMHAGNVVIGGIVRGDIFSSEMVTILSTGMVIGTITTPRLIIEDGVIFNGVCRVSEKSTEEAVESEKINTDTKIMQNNSMPHAEDIVGITTFNKNLAQNYSNLGTS
jgi:cytoskeletal protein CcmA (bactofilin family)